MLDLAPVHKTGLAIKSPLMVGGGAFGFADEYGAMIDLSRVGALITNPITFKPRRPAAEPAVLPFAGGVLVHTGLPNPGIGAAIRTYEKKWDRLGTAVIVHLAATNPEETLSCVQRLESVEAVQGIALGFRDEAPLAEAQAIIRAAAQRARQPVLVILPHGRATAWARMAERAGAHVLVATAPPRGSVRHPASGEWVRGRLYGAALLPQTLQLLRDLKLQTSLPIIGAGGVHTKADLQSVRQAGATAALIDSAVWVSPRQVASLTEPDSAPPTG